MTIKTYSFPSFFTVFLSVVLNLCSIIAGYAQPRVYENGQPTLTGLDAGIHLESPTRKRIDLAGKWTFSVDNDQWFEVKVPSSFDEEGRTTFRRKFAVGDSLLRSSAFKFVTFGINYEAEVYINDVFIGKHVGGYTAFEFDIPEDVLQLGPENFIQIVVSNQLSGRSTLPVRKQVWGWRNYGGMVRDVYILAAPRLWIDELTARTSLDEQLKQGAVEIQTRMSSRSFSGFSHDSLAAKSKTLSYLFTVELYDKLSDAFVAQSEPQPLTFEPNRDLEVQTTVAVNNPKLWSPDAPELYVVRASIVSMDGKQKTVHDQFVRVIGFTKVAVEKNTLLVNGIKTTLKGVVWHEDSPSHGGSMSYEQMEKDVALIKSLGANAVRFAFHPPHPYVLNLCSRYGLFALEEIPVWNVPAEILADESFQTLADAQIREMIARDQSNPAVLAWGIGDQFDSADRRALDFVKREATLLRSLDQRPVYFGSRMVANDLCAASVDFAAVNLASADLKTFKRLLSDWKRVHQNQPVLLLSYGKEVDHGNRNGYSDPLSQEAQARFFLQYYAAIKEAGIAGSFISAFADWRGDRPIMNVNLSDHYLHPVGLVSYAREKRLAYDMVKSLYAEEKISAIPVGNYRSSFPVAHVLSGLFIIILVGYQYAYNRRFGEAVRRSLLRSYNFFADLRDLRAVSLFQTLLLALMVSATLAVILSSVLYHYRSDKFADYILTYLVVSDILKEQFIRATWHPLTGIVAFSGVFFVLFGFLALLIKSCSVFVKRKIHWFHAYAVAVWGAMPLVFLSPVAMSLFKLMENSFYVIPSLILVLLCFAWAFLRILKGISVIYDVSSIKTYVGGLFVCALLLGGVFFYYDSTYALSSYVKLVVNLARSVG